MGIGNAIKAQRLQLNMTQEELAAAMGYKSKSTINKIEMGINDIPLSKVSEFARALHTTTAELMGWDNKPQEYDPIKDANWDKFREAFGMSASSGSVSDSLQPLLDAWLSLSDEGQEQLIQYAKFLLSQEEK